MNVLRRGLALVLFVLVFIGFLPAQQGRHFPGTISLVVDASGAAEKIFHATLVIPVKAGPLTLVYPKWIPGEHGPTGPIADLTGLKFTAGGQRLEWRRDDVNMYAIHVTVPAGVKELTVALDYTSPAERHGFSAGSTASAQLAVLNWNWVLLYPDGYAAQEITYRASMRLPSGWQSGTALPVASRAGQTVEFQPATLYTLVDSPVIMGRYFRAVPLTAAGFRPAVEMNIAADSAAALDMSPQLQQRFRQLVAESTKLWGATHYRDYHFLLSLSNHIAHFGLEHHESNDSRTSERSLVDPQQSLLMATLLPHEYVHSWNGKYRRPAGLTTPDFMTPQKGDLLWVYEGMTEYWGDVLAARSGLLNPEQYRDLLALTAASMEYQSGRTWRPLIDTAVDAQDLYEASPEWTNWRRFVDFYYEGELLWLAADTMIRNLSGGRKSLDDFCPLFAGSPGLHPEQAPGPKTYTFDDLLKLLNQVAPYDWRKFFQELLWSTSPRAPLEGLEASGWKLVFTETPSDLMKITEARRKFTNLTYSIGMTLSNEDGRILDVVFGSPVEKSGIMPGMKLVAVNGRAWDPEGMRDALRAAKTNTEPLQLLIENAEYYKTYAVEYHGGNRYPHLIANGKPDLLTEIVKQRAATAP